MVHHDFGNNCLFGKKIFDVRRGHFAENLTVNEFIALLLKSSTGITDNFKMDLYDLTYACYNYLLLLLSNWL